MEGLDGVLQEVFMDGPAKFKAFFIGQVKHSVVFLLSPPVPPMSFEGSHSCLPKIINPGSGRSPHSICMNTEVAGDTIGNVDVVYFIIDPVNFSPLISVAFWLRNTIVRKPSELRRIHHGGDRASVWAHARDTAPDDHIGEVIHASDNPFLGEAAYHVVVATDKQSVHRFLHCVHKVIFDSIFDNIGDCSWHCNVLLVDNVSGVDCLSNVTAGRKELMHSTGACNKLDPFSWVGLMNTHAGRTQVGKTALLKAGQHSQSEA